MSGTTSDDRSRAHLITSSPRAPAAALGEAAQPDAVSPSVSIPTTHLGWSVFKNTAAQVAGRSFIALTRLVVAGIIVRGFGMGIFGEYALIFGILSIAEWLLDFGTTEVFVREICREPERRPRLLRMMTAGKMVQIPAAFAILVAILMALRYPAPIVEAGLVGGASLVFFAGVLVYRVIFKANLMMEREVTAELLSVLVMIPLIALVASHGGGLTELIGCHLISRAVFFGLCFFFGRSQYRPSLEGVTWHDVRWSLRSSATIGVIGFLVVVYEAVDILMLSRLASLSDLAYYSGAQRLVWPMLMALAAIGGTLYPIAASYWPRARSDFERACQRGVDTVVVLAGLATCSVLAGAEFFMGLLGPDLRGGVPALRVLAVLCFVKAISSTVGPLLYVVKAQKQAVQFVAVALAVKVAVIAALAPRFGYMGVAFGALAVEVCFAAAPAVYLVQRFSGYQVRWMVPLKVVMITVAAAIAPRLLLSASGLPAAVAAPALYAALAFLAGAVRLEEVRSLVRWKTP